MIRQIGAPTKKTTAYLRTPLHSRPGASTDNAPIAQGPAQPLCTSPRTGTDTSVVTTGNVTSSAVILKPIWSRETHESHAFLAWSNSSLYMLLLLWRHRLQKGRQNDHPTRKSLIPHPLVPLSSNKISIWCRCSRCRKQKIKCSGLQPCEGCRKRKVPCNFDDSETKVVVSRAYMLPLSRMSASYDLERTERGLPGTSWTYSGGVAD